MAKIELTIRRDNGVTLVASGEVADEQVLDMCSAVGAMLFEAAVGASTPEPVVDEPAVVEPAVDEVVVPEDTVLPSDSTPVSG